MRLERSITLLILISSYEAALKFVQASVGECDFEKYASGCFASADFVCDRFTNQCKCLPHSPILIEHRLCLPRVTANEICRYNEQCDNQNGFYCTYSDKTLVDPVNNPSPPKDNPRCRNLNDNYVNESARTRIQHQQKQHQVAPQQNIVKPNQGHSSHNHNSSPFSHLPRLLWIFLLGCLLGLVVLLLLIKSQYNQYQHHSGVRRTFQCQEDRLSTNSEIDVPPSYEVAIRMKL